MIMNKMRCYLAAFIWLFGVAVCSADVIVESSCDSVGMWIGEQTGIHISVTCDNGQDVLFPQFSDTIVRNLEIVSPYRTDTQYIDKKKRMTLTRSFTVTSFDSAFIYIPPFEVLVDSVPYRAKEGLSLAVHMFDVDTTATDQFFGPKDIMKQPLKWQDFKLLLFSLLLSVALAVLTILLFRGWKDDKPIVRIIKIAPQKPPHDVALAEIERIRTDNLAHSDDAKRYYTELTDAIRVYMNERFGFNATEMTSDEILDNLMDISDKTSLNELKNLLQTSDLVKFAKVKPLIGENDRNLLTAIQFVKETMIEEKPAEKQPEQRVVVQKRSKESRTMLLVSVISSAIASCVFLFILLREMYYLLF